VARLLDPGLVSSVIRAVGLHQIQPPMRESARMMQHGLEVLSYVVCYEICDLPYSGKLSREITLVFKSEQTTKVFSLESFSLYGIIYIHTPSSTKIVHVHVGEMNI